MSLLQWNSRYEIGHSKIDEQHRRFFMLLNALYDAMKEKKGTVAIEEAIDELFSYAQLHFADEEELMRGVNYPDLEAHQLEHLKMTRRVLEMRAEQRNGTLPVTFELLNFINSWIAEHILSTDAKIYPYLAMRETASGD